MNGDHGNSTSMGKSKSVDVVVDVNVVEDEAKDVKDDEADADDHDEEEEEEEKVEVVEKAESQDAEWVKEKQVAAKTPLQMIGVQLLKDSNETIPSSKKSRRKASGVVEAVDRGGNAAKVGLKAGDQILYTNSFFSFTKTSSV